MSRTPLVIAGSSHPLLARKIAANLKGRITDYEVTRFAIGEFRVRILGSIKDQDVIVVQSLTAPCGEHLLELAQLVNAVQGLQPRRVIGVVPWLAYSLQDQAFRKGEPVTAKIIADSIDALRLDKLILVDIHSPAVLRFFATPLHHVRHADIFTTYIRPYVIPETVFVAPDTGAREHARDLAASFSSKIIVLKKHRNLRTGAISIEDPVISLQNASCIICDDLAITAGTVVEAAKILLHHGARDVMAVITHPLMTKTATHRLISSRLIRIIVSDTTPNRWIPRTEKLTVVSSTNSIVLALGRIIGQPGARRGETN